MRAKQIAPTMALLLLCSALPFATSGSARADVREGDVLFADFEGETYGDWTVEGDAFGPGPAKGTLPGQVSVDGYSGERLVNSYYNGDGTTGKLTSPEIELTKPYVNFLIGGGGHPGVRFELLVGDQVVRIARGPNVNPGGSEKLDWGTWDVSDLQGKKARFRIVDEETGGWGHINVDQIVLGDKKKSGIANERELTIEKRYLCVPIGQDRPRRWVRVEVDGLVRREFEAGLREENDAPTSRDFVARIDMGDWLGQKMKFVVEKADEDIAFAPLTFSDDAYGEDDAYNEKYRPQFHFCPRYGWTNDPNGLVYHDGIYELFFQHNPFGTQWGNMTWGHATSPDLLHWTEKGDAIYADRLGTVFSGSGAVDVANSTGFQTDPNGPAPLVFMFTQNGPNMRYGEQASQNLAYSLDGGKTLIKYEGNPTIPWMIGGNRDPKIFWDKNKERWVTALYLDGEDYALFASKDLKSWDQLCKIEKLGCSECPDIFELPVDGDESNKQWVFWGGNGKYLLGTFDGETFVRTTEPLDAKWGGNDYAAQTYSDTPGRRIQFSWMSGGEYPGMPFNQQFTVPRELTLRTTPEGVRLNTYPVVELETLRDRELDLTKKVGDSGVEYLAKSSDASSVDLLDVEATLKIEGDETIVVAIRGQEFELNAKEKTIKYAEVVAPLAVVDSKVALRLVLDRTSLEIFTNGGLSQIAKCFVPADDNESAVLEVSKDRVESLKVWTMKSVWNQ
ncbi:MAG: glycoside hydrolase family 32 protein [Thermoguttaceae bacterium]|nr:glycoside hydrolase family 32 protein [Thermoguttaceae bacterium]